MITITCWYKKPFFYYFYTTITCVSSRRRWLCAQHNNHLSNSWYNTKIIICQYHTNCHILLQSTQPLAQSFFPVVKITREMWERRRHVLLVTIYALGFWTALAERSALNRHSVACVIMCTCTYALSPCVCVYIYVCCMCIYVFTRTCIYMYKMSLENTWSRMWLETNSKQCQSLSRYIDGERSQHRQRKIYIHGLEWCVMNQQHHYFKIDENNEIKNARV